MGQDVLTFPTHLAHFSHSGSRCNDNSRDEDCIDVMDTRFHSVHGEKPIALRCFCRGCCLLQTMKANDDTILIIQTMRTMREKTGRAGIPVLSFLTWVRCPTSASLPTRLLCLPSRLPMQLARLRCLAMNSLLLVLPVPWIIIWVFNIPETLGYESAHRAMLRHVNLGRHACGYNLLSRI